MSDPQRREFLAAAGMASLAALGGAPAGRRWRSELHEQRSRPDCSPARICRPSSSRWRSRTARSSATATARRRRSSNCRSPRGSPASRCGSSRARCASCTGTPPRPSGRSCSRAASAPPSSTRGGLAETNDFDPGDVWYFPRGHGHMLQCLGDKPCHFILIFDNGYFSEFGTFSITDWIGHTPPGAAGEELRPARSGVRRRSRRRKSISRAAQLPPAEPSVPLQGWKLPPETHKYRLLAQPPHATYHGRPRVARRFQPLPDLRRRSPASSSISIPARCASCTGTRTPTSGSTSSRARSASPCSARTAATGPRRLQKGDVGYIPQGYGHSIENVGSGPARILIGFNTGIYETIDLSQWIAGKSQGRARHQFRPAGGSVRKVPGPRRVHRRQGWDPIGEGRQERTKTSTDLAAQSCLRAVGQI